MTRPPIPLTREAIDGLEPGNTRIVVSFHDETGKRIPGLRLFLSPAGGRTFYFQYRGADRVRNVRVESYKPHHFEMAQRPRVLETIADMDRRREQGETIKPTYREIQQAARAEAQAEKRNAHRPTLKTVCKDYVTERSREGGPHYKKSWKEDRRLLNKDILPKLGNRIAADLTRDEIRAVLREVAERGPTIGNRVQAALTTCLSWAAEEGTIVANPLYGMRKVGGSEQSRDRDLNPAEIKNFWHGVESQYRPTFIMRGKDIEGDPLPVMAEELAISLKLLLLTGCRRGEVAHARWSEVDLDAGLWEIPRDRTKTGAPLVVPLVPEVVELLKRLRKITGATGFWLPGKRQKKGGGFEYTGAPIRPETLTHALRDAQERGVFGKVPSFVVHDLRRTMRTRIVALGVTREIAERTLNHKIAGRTEKAYDRYQYIDEKRDALARWGRYVRELVGEGADVVQTRS